MLKPWTDTKSCLISELCPQIEDISFIGALCWLNPKVISELPVIIVSLYSKEPYFKYHHN